MSNPSPDTEASLDNWAPWPLDGRRTRKTPAPFQIQNKIHITAIWTQPVIRKNASPKHKLVRETMLYFAYGSNMCTNRLRAKDRVPSAEFVQTARLAKHIFRFHKRSDKDCS